MNDWRTAAITIGISSIAICMPMQARGPAPKGIHAYRCPPGNCPAGTSKRSGSNISGSGHTAGEMVDSPHRYLDPRSRRNLVAAENLVLAGAAVHTMGTRIEPH